MTAGSSACSLLCGRSLGGHRPPLQEIPFVSLLYDLGLRMRFDGTHSSHLAS